MSDDLDFPPSRPLPEGIRDRARHQLTEGMSETRRPSRRTPLVIAAAVVLLAAAGAVVTQTTRGGEALVAVDPNPTTVRQLPPPDLVDMFHARDGWVPADAVDRCAAVAQGLPPKDRWTPLMTTVVHATTLTAFTLGPDGVFFCEATPSSVTVSAPEAPDTGGAPAKIGFISTNGSVAGFVQPQVGHLRMDAAATSAHALIAGDVFLTTQGFPGIEKGVTFVVDGTDERPAEDLPQPSPATVDRPQPPGDRTSAEGRRLGACLDTAPHPAPDKPNWVPGAHALLSPTDEVQLGRYGDLLAVCAIGNEVHPTTTLHVVDLADITGRYASGAQLDGKTIWGTGHFYDFQPVPEGGTGSDSRGFVGRVTDTRVATITLTREGFPDAVAVIRDGTFILAGAATKGLSTVPPGVKVTVRDARGAVIEELLPAD